MNDKGRNTAIDLMKIAGASLIILHHYQQGTGMAFRYITFYNGKFNFGYIVELFFVISGLLAYKSLKNGENMPSLWIFSGVKARRIVPLLSLSVVVEAVLRYTYLLMSEGGEYEFGLLDIMVNATGTGWGIFQVKTINQPTWYISVLMLCYLEIYAAIWLSKKLSINENYIYILLMSIGIAATTYSWRGPFINESMGRGMFSFFAGAILGQYLKRRVRKKNDWMILILPVLFVLLLMYFHDFVESGRFVFYTMFLWVPIVILAVSYIPQVKYGKRIVEMLGHASFGVYIWNEPLAVIRNMLSMAWNINIQTESALLIFSICNWFAGIGSYYLIERPIGNALKRGWNGRRP